MTYAYFEDAQYEAALLNVEEKKKIARAVQLPDGKYKVELAPKGKTFPYEPGDLVACDWKGGVVSGKGIGYVYEENGFLMVGVSKVTGGVNHIVMSALSNVRPLNHFI